MVRPKKHLGQHFLTDGSIARRIVDALQFSEGDTVLEIGAGTGILTGLLLQQDIRLFTVEIDRESVAHLLKKWPALSEMLIEDDFLKMDLDRMIREPYHVIGNFPYNISSQIFFRILDQRMRISSVVCTIQKEVADRITSPPGSRQYGILSVLLRAYFDTEYLFTVKPGSFFPPPQVTSGVIRLVRNGFEKLPCNEKLFFRVVKTTFNQRRKMLRNSLKSILLNLDGNWELLTKRPEELDIPEFIELTRWVETQLAANR
ncbi:MAG TPA: 16S rRNA (adenine(1518)-N(6)/adenine(1519)-N(6))-dimethyltransferase RsmA [Bacteroides sp.]|nr:16S rRNA (adenine(1518)-N(6)/adenine(1519)-N(6))-dimethyltransferase RsmA [Bacteroides sp.]